MKHVTIVVPACSVRGCQRPRAARGVCMAHYMRNYREKKNAAGERTSPAAQEASRVSGRAR